MTDNLNLAHAPSHTAQAHSSYNSGVSNATGDHKLTPDQLLFSQLSESMCSMFADHADVMTMLGVKCLDEGVYNLASNPGSLSWPTKESLGLRLCTTKLNFSSE